MDPVIETVALLERRIEERFPGAGLANVCANVLIVARRTRKQVESISEPLTYLRVGIVSVILTALLLAGWLVANTRELRKDLTVPELVTVSESSFNVLLLGGGAVFYLVTLERRLQRRKALRALHELRTLAHVIDMHQLTKDPYAAAHPKYKHTPSSPQRIMTLFEVRRYLDYCSEMFSLLGKLAAAYAERIDDPTVIAAVNEMEALTTNLAAKVWRKITTIESDKD
jgi:hypothetical protein